MQKEMWKGIIIKAVDQQNTGDATQLNLIVDLLKDYEDAKQILREKGMWDFVNMKSTVRDLN